MTTRLMRVSKTMADQPSLKSTTTSRMGLKGHSQSELVWVLANTELASPMLDVSNLSSKISKSVMARSVTGGRIVRSRRRMNRPLTSTSLTMMTVMVTTRTPSRRTSLGGLESAVKTMNRVSSGRRESGRMRHQLLETQKQTGRLALVDSVQLGLNDRVWSVGN